MTGPPTRPTMATADQAVIALRRSFSSVKTVIRIDSVDGMISAPPTPIATRPATSCGGVSAKVAARLAAPKTASPMTRIRRRPYRSDRLPAISSGPANTRM
ncbi:hypothetical protein GCM10027610_084370 [Dactylosporangium cerinum]